MKAPEIHHRHVSHLYGLYPSDQIHVREHAGTGGRGAQDRWRFAATTPPAGPSPGV